MAHSPTQLHCKKLRINAIGEGSTFELALLENTEPDALMHAVCGRMSVSSRACVFFTLSSDPKSMLIPLSSSLPDGAELFMHRSESAWSPRLEPLATRRRVRTADGELSTSSLHYYASPRMSPAASPSHSPRPTTTATHRSRRKSGDSSRRLASPLLASREHSPRSVRIAAPPADLPPSVVISATVDEAPVDKRTEAEDWSSTGPGTDGGTTRRPSFRNLFRSRSREMQEPQSNAELAKEMCNAMERFSRMTTDLANERTLLSWIRTTLAAIRTVFAYFALTANGSFWENTLICSELTMAVLVIVTALTGYRRFDKIKNVIRMKHPPESFGRISVRYVYSLVAASSIVTVVSIFFRHWDK